MGLTFDENKIIERYEVSCIEIECIRCKLKKPVPAQRTEPICDDCVYKIYDETRKEQQKEDRIKMLNGMRIPERYRKLEDKEFEVDNLDFLLVGERSIAICGEVGTGKTQLACAVLIRRACGIFLTGEDLLDEDLNKLKNHRLICVDDITKIDVKKSKNAEKVFNFFNYRYSELKDTIITTDKSMEEIKTYFGDIGESLVSRFRSWMFFIKLSKKWR